VVDHQRAGARHRPRQWRPAEQRRQQCAEADELEKGAPDHDRAQLRLLQPGHGSPSDQPAEAVPWRAGPGKIFYFGVEKSENQAASAASWMVPLAKAMMMVAASASLGLKA